VQQWLQSTGVAYTLKDLEKALGPVAGITGMNVKPFLDRLQGENMVRVEKIGSGNWYWNFASDEKVKREDALRKARSEQEKLETAVQDLESKVAEATAARAEDEDEMLMEAGQDRDSMLNLHADLSKELDAARTELAGYSNNDPVEIERRKAKLVEDRVLLEALTDAIYSMESWFKQRIGGDRAQMAGMKQRWYGTEYDEEAGGLRDI